MLERLALAEIARVTGVSQGWLQMYVNQKSDQTPKQVEVTKKKGRLTIELDKMCSKVGFYPELAVDLVGHRCRHP